MTEQPCCPKSALILCEQPLSCSVCTSATSSCCPLWSLAAAEQTQWDLLLWLVTFPVAHLAKPKVIVSNFFFFIDSSSW